ncbi:MULTISPECIES: hypothetical protein [Mycolicibacter]|nr:MULTISPECIES: hypothetical protein [Mycolicibacter]OBJ33692.1 hypothetical protein A5631_05400 [Mycolicibacter heraklionensis]
MEQPEADWIDGRVRLRDGALNVQGRLKWPTDTNVTPEQAIGAVWERLQVLPSMKMACGYVGHDLNIDPILLYAWVLQDQREARKRPPAIAEPQIVTIDSIAALPDGAVVRASGQVLGIRLKSNTRGMPWVNFALWQRDRHVDVTAFGETYEKCAHFLVEDAVVTVEGRKWFHEDTTISATTVIREN